MTPKEILDRLRGFVAPDLHPAWSAFCAEMRDKQYGEDPCMQAWSFFRDGWDAAKERSAW